VQADEALAFLRAHQPLSDDDQLSEALVRRYHEGVSHFRAHADERSVPLLLGSFGRGTGHGVYQLVEDTLAVYGPGLVSDALLDAVAAAVASVREWSFQIAGAGYADRRFLEATLKSLRSPTATDDERYWSASVLAVIYEPASDEATVREILADEQNDDIKRLLLGCLER